MEVEAGTQLNRGATARPLQRTAVINVVGLTPALIGEHTPRIEAYRRTGRMTSIVPAFPAVTCTAQADYLTGRRPTEHGIVGNGWYQRELAEVHFWKQSNHLVQARKVWDEVRASRAGEPGEKFSVAKLFWWFNMYSTADYSITPRPMYPADGRKVFDIYTWPFDIRADIKKDLGEFPFPTFWGPAAGRQTPQGGPDAASRWIADSAKWVEEKHRPSLSLIYLPHLDYNLQRHGVYATQGASGGDGRSSCSSKGTGLLNPAILPDLRAIDVIVGDLLDFFTRRDVQVLLLSEYGITNVDQPVHLNRVFREKGWLTIKEELSLEILDCGASRVFAVADHQVAHVYCNDLSIKDQVRRVLEALPGVDQVLGRKEKAAMGIAHPRAGDYVVVAKPQAWFTYYFWLEDAFAPDFARCVDIHRKPGYDPVELFLDPAIPVVKLKILWRLLQKRLGFRMLMDVIPLDASLVKGSHGRRPASPCDGPVLIAPQGLSLPSTQIQSTDVCGLIRQAVMGVGGAGS